jgi:hypothetical protein
MSTHVLERLSISRALNGSVRLMFRCPYHDDRNPSFSVIITDGHIASMKCFAGCKLDYDRRMEIKDMLTSDSRLLGLISEKGERMEKLQDVEKLLASFCSKRGISLDTAKAFGLKIVTSDLEPSLSKIGATAGVLIPLKGLLHGDSYQIRILLPESEEKRRRFLSASGSNADLYVISETNGAPVIFCEGPIKGIVLFEVLHALDIPASVVCTTGVSSAQSEDVIKALAGFVSKTNASKVIIAMDADEAGMRASNVLLRRLSGLNVRVTEIDHNTVRNELTLLGSEQFGIDDYVIAMKRAGKLNVGNAIPVVRRLKPVSVAKIVGQSQSFLFEPLIPLGVMTIIEGNPGCGKSFLTVGLSCSVATGKPLCLGENVLTPSVSGSVLVFSCEDSPTVVSMRTAMLHRGNRPENVYYEFEPFDMVKSLDEIEDLVQMYKPKLVIIDPLMNYMGAESDVYRDNAVRAVLTPYTKMASKYGFAFVVVRHLRKNAGDAAAVCRGIGSIGFSGLARCVLSLEQDENGVITVSVAKHSYMPIRTSFSYTIGDMRVG